LTPLKDACLRRCRSPLGTLLRRGSVRAGIEHGAFCLGCCWALMLALVALGIGSMLWMAALAAVVLVEKVAPLGERAPALVAAGLAGAAVWIAV
jgi:predicted metal-binding membrane protein